MSELSLSRLARASWAHVAFAFLAMGGWALFANRAHGLAGAAAPALVQGTLSAGLTFGIKRTLEAMFAKLKGPVAVVLPPLTTAAAVFCILVGAHTLARTPEVWATIAVPFAVSTTYAFVYTAGLATARRRAEGGA